MQKVKFIVTEAEFNRNNLKITEEVLKDMINKPIIISGSPVGVIQGYNKLSDSKIEIDGQLFNVELLPSFIVDGEDNIKISSMGLFAKR